MAARQRYAELFNTYLEHIDWMPENAKPIEGYRLWFGKSAALRDIARELIAERCIRDEQQDLQNFISAANGQLDAFAALGAIVGEDGQAFITIPPTRPSSAKALCLVKATRKAEQLLQRILMQISREKDFDPDLHATLDRIFHDRLGELATLEANLGGSLSTFYRNADYSLIWDGTDKLTPTEKQRTLIRLCDENIGQLVTQKMLNDAFPQSKPDELKINRIFDHKSTCRKLYGTLIITEGRKGYRLNLPHPIPLR